MNAFVVLAHPEPQSFNGALYRTAIDTLRAAGHTVAESDLHALRFDPVSGRHNFTTTKDPDTLKLQLEELHATANAGFAPDIETELRKIEACDLMIWQFPLWWFGLPAILKGWVDRVFAMGRAYGGGRVYGAGVWRGKRALLSLTTGGPEPAYLKDGFNGDLAGILRPIHRGVLRGVLEFCGFDVLAPQVTWGPARLTDEQRAAALAVWAERLRGIGAEPSIEVGAY